jgi:hypothetical protein
MVSPSSSPVQRRNTASGLIAGLYEVDLGSPLPGAGGGLPSFAVISGSAPRRGLMAVQVRRLQLARVHALQTLSGPIDGVLAPLAHGPAPAPGGEGGYFVISHAPPGPSLAETMRPWAEADLLDWVLRPVAQGLVRLHAQGVTHRAIRLDNLFQAAPGQPVVLGAAWSAPPASLQPALFEPPGSAMCLPCGRGEGGFGDDVYALGVVLLCLALGRLPLADLDDAAIIRRKLDFGSYGTLVGDERLSPMIADLVRGMLAEDPEHRPTPALLLDPVAARARRVAARPPRRAQRPLEFGGVPVWDARQLAFALAADPSRAPLALRGGGIDRWLRRGLGDAALAARIDDLIRHPVADVALNDARSDAILAMRVVALLDPLAPVCWRGIAVWPDGVGPALAAALDTDPDSLTRLEELVTAEAIDAWAQSHPERSDPLLLRIQARQMHVWPRLRGPSGGLPRLLYQLNPLMPCASPLLRSQFVTRLGELLPALEAVSAGVDPARTRPIDPHIAAFIAARAERRLEAEIASVTDSDDDANGARAQLRLFAELQARTYPYRLPGLAVWLSRRSAALRDSWHNRKRRADTEERMRLLADGGMLTPMLALIEDPLARDADARGARDAAAAVARIDAELLRMRTGTSERARLADRLGQEVAAGVGLAALAAVLTVAALG